MTGLLMKRIGGFVPVLVALAVPAMAARITAPVNGGRIADGPVHIIGQLAAGEEKANFLLDGKPMKGLKRDGLSFFVSFVPPAGQHKFEVADAGKETSLSFFYGGSSSGTYSYHKPVTEGKCGECHKKGRQRLDLSKEAVCFNCHSAWRHAFVHGPVATGGCVICHDPHGSVDSAMIKMDELKLCISCHDQPSSQKHIEGEKKDCRTCHDPHGSNDSKFFVRKRK